MLKRALIAALSSIPQLASATDIPSANSDAEAEKAELMKLFQEQTDIATRTRLNVDYVPGIVDVLRGTDLADRGARTVWEAMAFVPGVNPVTDQLGHPRLMVRGLGGIGSRWASGYVKTMLNGIAMDSDERGFADPVMLIPIAQVDRIEVIRGPGSAVHGEFAVAGAVNVITVSEQSRVFAMGGSFNQIGTGAILSAGTEELRFSANLGFWRDDGADVRSGQDALYGMGLGGASYAPGNANEGTEARNGVVRLAYKGLSLIGQWSQSKLGDAFGVNGHLPPPEDQLVEDQRIRQVEVRYALPLSSGKAEFYAGNRNYRVTKDDQFVSGPAIYGITGAPDVVVDLDYEEDRRYWGGSLLWEAGDHQLLFGAERARTDVLQGSQAFNFLYQPGIGFIIDDTMREYGYPVPEGTVREVTSLLLQDDLRLSDEFTLTVGARRDDYSELGAHWSPRVAGVWRLTARDTLKAQVGQAFRPPTLTEMMSADLEPVTISTVELGYARKETGREWRVTTAYSELVDAIILDESTGSAVNAKETARIFSIEADIKQELTSELLARAAIAYNQSRSDEGQDSLPGSSEWLLTAGMNYRLDDATTLNADYRYISNYARERSDPRDDLGSSNVVNVTLSHRTWNGFNLRAGVANLFDQTVRYPAFMVTGAGPGQIPSYPEDLPRAGRTWQLSVIKEF